MVTSINKLRIELKELIEANAYVNQFYWKDLGRAMAENGDINYPLVCAFKSTGTLLVNQDRIQLTIDVADLLYSDFTNLNDVESDTLNMCRQIFNGMQSVRWKKIGRIEACTVRYFMLQGADNVAGHTMTIDFTLRDKNGVCDLPFFGYDFDQVVSGEATSVTVFNSDMSYTQVVDCGGTLELPDISYSVKNTLGTVLSSGTSPSVVDVTTELSDVNNVDSDGTVIPTPAGVPFVCTPFSCDPATITINSQAFTTVASGDTENILVLQSDDMTQVGSKVGTHWRIADSNITNSDLTYDVDVKAEDSLVLPDSQINVNSVSQGSVVSVKTIDVNITDGSSPVAPDSVSLVGNTLTIAVPAGGATPWRPVLTNHTTLTSAPTWDDGSATINTTTNRFTDTTGAQTYANDIVLDWFTFDPTNETIHGWYRVELNNLNWADSETSLNAASYGGYSTWRLPKFCEICQIWDKTLTSVCAYAPFNYTTGFARFWTADTYPSGTTNAYALQQAGVTVIQLAKTTATTFDKRLATRIFTITTGGLS